MTYFAKVIDGRVHEVIVADQAFIESGAVGDPAQWIQASKTLDETTIRKNPPQVGGYYSAEADAFYGIKPYASWILNTTTYVWEAPVARPEGYYQWNESTQTWVEINLP